MKNLNFKKYFLQTNPLEFMKPIINYAKSESESGELDKELQTASIKCLISLMCLSFVHLMGGPRKFYIPGETVELNRLKVKAIEYGIFTLLASLDLKLADQDPCKVIFQRDFWSLLDEEDFPL